MNFLIIGDVVGRSGRNALQNNLKKIQKKFSIDFTIINGENSAGGYGITGKIYEDIISCGANAVTLGNHAWDQKEMLSYIEECPKIVRALNYPEGVPGKGYYELELHDGRKITIVQVMLRLFMGLFLNDPFSITKKYLQKEKIGTTTNAILIDMHGETTSEKNAFGHYFDGKVSAILGTHTHIPTADAKILSGGTAYQTDVGMTGDYNSVIGMDKANPIHGFVKGYRAEGRYFPADEKITICGTFIETDDKTGLSVKIEPFQI